MLHKNMFGCQTEWFVIKAYTPVRNQQKPGSCWAFATAGCIELAYQSNYNRQIILSPQALADGLAEEEKDAKLVQIINPNPVARSPGNSISCAFDWFIRKGLVCESDYQCVDRQNDHRQERSQPEKFVAVWRVHTVYSEQSIKATLQKQLPLATIIYVNEAFAGLANEIFEGVSSHENYEAHCVIIIGYGTDASTGKPYWIIKNSYGERWGVLGYGRIAAGAVGFGTYPIIS